MKIKPQRIRLSRAKGFNLQAHSKSINGLEAVKVDRSTKWGNPFTVGKDGTRKECVEAFRNMCGGYMYLSGKAGLKEQIDYMKHAKAHLHELRGKNLACWCQLPKDGEPDLCHAAILLEAANK